MTLKVERALFEHAVAEGIKFSDEWKTLHPGPFLLGEHVKKVAEGALRADRARMAEQLRNRVMRNATPAQLPGDLSMKIDALMLDLADQIEKGMPPS